jgi:hypothetical protein
MAAQSSGFLGRARLLVKRARGDVWVSQELSAVRRELDEIRSVGEATLRGVSRRAGPYALARPAIRRRFEPPHPWMATGAVEHVASLLDTGMVGVEWGGGASTPYWCERLGVLHTFEADRGFALLLIDYMTKHRHLVDRWRLHFVPCNWATTTATVRKKGIPLPSDEVKEALTRDYAALIADHVDVVFVDGSVREATIDATARYIARDRPLVVVVDNTDADYVAQPLATLDTSGYIRHDYAEEGDQLNEGWTTTVFVRKD